MGEHCATCICGRRAPVQDDHRRKKPAGTITWEEHIEAYGAYAAKYGHSQSAERLAERGGFGYGELVDLLGRDPKTWAARRAERGDRHG